MFEFNKEALEQAKAKKMATKMFSRMMSDAILESDAPEHMKLSIRVMDKSEDLADAIHDLIVRYVEPHHVANAETLKKVLEYLAMVEIGIKQFAETTPFVAHTEEE